MRSSRSFVAFGQLALLTLALVSCGGQMVPQAQSGQNSSGQPAPQAAGQISTLKVRSGTTEADLLSRYPSSKVLALHADEGYALMYSAGKLTEKQSLGALSLNAQALAVTTTEPDLTLSTSVTDPAAEAQGNTAWAGGNTAWAGGNTAWAGGTSSGGSISALSDNAAAWTKLDLGSAQKLAPTLGTGVRVAVLDTGVDSDHPAFGGKIDVGSGWDYVGNDGLPQEENWATSGYSKAFGHGTAVTGVILQVAPNAIIMPYRVLNPNGAGRLSNIIMAVNDAVKHSAKVINMSLGTNSPSPALNTAISSAIKSGAMVVSSSGNSGDDNVTYPARYSTDMQTLLGGGLISVASVSSTDKKSSFSTCGLSIDLLAPGEAVATTFPNTQVTRATGTSFAAPMVSGAVALAMGSGRTDPIALYKAIKLSATAPTDTLYQNLLGSGTLNIGKLMVTK